MRIDTNSVTLASEFVLGFMKLMTMVTRMAIRRLVIVEVRAATACRKVFMKMFWLKVWHKVDILEFEKYERIFYSQ